MPGSRDTKGKFLRALMQKIVLSLTFISATLFAAAADANDPKKAPATPMTDEQTALVKRFDLNGDGRLDESELAAAHETMLRNSREGVNPADPAAKKFRSALVKRFDRNGDGVLDESERASARQWALARFDTNHDGRIDEDERAAMREQLKAEAKALKFKN
ncbi:MAG: hypothetical protein JWM35_92 [Verrucomicrobia bacterium]|nr:hypothetical protein [Verrucomicrobiota bacterium]